MVTAHLETVLARVANVLVIAWIDIISAFGGLDIDELDFTLFLQFLPVDVALVLGYVDAVELHIVGVQRRRGLGLLGHSSLGRVVGRLIGLFVFLRCGSGLRLFLFGLVFFGNGRLDIGFLLVLLDSLFIVFLVLLDTFTRRLGDVGMLWQGNTWQRQEA